MESFAHSKRTLPIGWWVLLFKPRMCFPIYSKAKYVVQRSSIWALCVVRYVTLPNKCICDFRFHYELPALLFNPFHTNSDRFEYHMRAKIWDSYVSHWHCYFANVTSKNVNYVDNSRWNTVIWRCRYIHPSDDLETQFATDTDGRRRNIHVYFCHTAYSYQLVN